MGYKAKFVWRQTADEPACIARAISLSPNIWTGVSTTLRHDISEPKQTSPVVSQDYCLLVPAHLPIRFIPDQYPTPCTPEVPCLVAATRIRICKTLEEEAGNTMHVAVGTQTASPVGDLLVLMGCPHRPRTPRTWRVCARAVALQGGPSVSTHASRLQARRSLGVTAALFFLINTAVADRRLNRRRTYSRPTRR